MNKAFYVVTLILCGLWFSAAAQPDGMVLVEQDTFMPFYSSNDDSITVKPFYLDIYPVTNAEFLDFVKANPEWRRSRVKSVFAEDGYLKHWAGDLDLGPNAEKIKKSPVTNVSWFAARAYAKWKGRRLPSLNEWELAASASEEKPIAGRDKKFVQKILDWYSRPNPETLPSVGRREANYHGIHDLHGLIWEWVGDFNTVFISGESRADQGELKQFYCAAGSSAASDIDKENYAAFLRYAFRGSLEADFSVGNLGFRTAKDKE
ncbi:MAG: formylglycine-generating enzyme family protein [Balneolaceae bacterium]|nr:formylglycine-generating enzyme family protein [Balneolaceae bacterium]